MSLSRKLLESLGLESDKVSTIIEAHAETVDGLKKEIEKYKASNEALESTTKELEAVKSELATLKADGGDWQKKYEQEKADFEAYKNDREAKDTLEAKKSAYESLLKETGVSEKSISKIIKLTDFSELELDEEGKLKDIDKAQESIKSEWGEFIKQNSTQGANTTVPPVNNATTFTAEEIAKMTPDEINKNWDAIKTSMKGNE